MSLRRNTQQNHNINIANKYFANVAKQIFENNARNENCIQEEIKSRLNSQKACYSAIQKIFTFPSPVQKDEY
jgi:hypothetical protein